MIELWSQVTTDSSTQKLLESFTYKNDDLFTIAHVYAYEVDTQYFPTTSVTFFRFSDDYE